MAHGAAAYIYKANLQAAPVEDRNGFWGEQAQLIHWNKGTAGRFYDFSSRLVRNQMWFVGGETSTPATTRLTGMPVQPQRQALVHLHRDRRGEDTPSQGLHRSHARMAAIYQNWASKGRPGLIYMPMIAEACFVMLSPAPASVPSRSVVFGGFASHFPGHADRRCQADGHRVLGCGHARWPSGSRHKHLLDDRSHWSAEHKPAAVLMVNRWPRQGHERVVAGS